MRTSGENSILAPMTYDPHLRLEEPCSEERVIGYPMSDAIERRHDPGHLELGDYPSTMPLSEAYLKMRRENNVLLPEERTALAYHMRAAKSSPNIANATPTPVTPKDKRESDWPIFNSTSHSNKALQILDASPSSRFSGRTSSTAASPLAEPATPKKKRESETVRLARMYHEALKEQSEASIKKVLEHPRNQQNPFYNPARREMVPRPLFETDAQVGDQVHRKQLVQSPPKFITRTTPGRLANNPKSILEHDILADAADDYWKETTDEGQRPMEDRQGRPKTTSFTSDGRPDSSGSSAMRNNHMRRSGGLTPLVTQFGELSPLLRPLDSPSMVVNTPGGGCFHQRFNSNHGRSKEMMEAAVDLRDKISGIGRLAADRVNLSLHKEKKRQREWELAKHEIKDRIRVIPNYD